KVYLERHQYAPELNTLYVRGVPFKAPGCTDIGSARRKVFPRKKGVLVATIKTVYNAIELQWLNQVRAQGRIENRLQAVRMARQLRAQNPGCVLADGSYLPPVRTVINVMEV